MVALAFVRCSIPSYDHRALYSLRSWLDSWSGIGHVAVGMHRHGYDLQLTQYDERGWRATFYTAGIALWNMGAGYGAGLLLHHAIKRGFVRL